MIIFFQKKNLQMYLIEMLKKENFYFLGSFQLEMRMKKKVQLQLQLFLQSFEK